MLRIDQINFKLEQFLGSVQLFQIKLSVTVESKKQFLFIPDCNIFTQQYRTFYGTQRALDLCQNVPRINERMLIFTNVFRFVCHTQTQSHITTHQINFVQHISYSIFKQCRLHISHPSHLITTYIYLTLHMQIFNNLIEFRDFQDLI